MSMPITAGRSGASAIADRVGATRTSGSRVVRRGAAVPRERDDPAAPAAVDPRNPHGLTP